MATKLLRIHGTFCHSDNHFRWKRRGFKIFLQGRLPHMSAGLISISYSTKKRKKSRPRVGILQTELDDLQLCEDIASALQSAPVSKSHISHTQDGTINRGVKLL